MRKRFLRSEHLRAKFRGWARRDKFVTGWNGNSVKTFLIVWRDSQVELSKQNFASINLSNTSNHINSAPSPVTIFPIKRNFLSRDFDKNVSLNSSSIAIRRAISSKSLAPFHLDLLIILFDDSNKPARDIIQPREASYAPFFSSSPLHSSLAFFSEMSCWAIFNKVCIINLWHEHINIFIVWPRFGWFQSVKSFCIPRFAHPKKRKKLWMKRPARSSSEAIIWKHYF